MNMKALFGRWSVRIRSNHKWPLRGVVALTLFIGLAWSQQSSAPAQQPGAPVATQNAPETTLTVNTRLVSLDVVVTDKSGKPVTDLKKEDFTVLERGQPERIAAFSFHAPKPDRAKRP